MKIILSSVQHTPVCTRNTQEKLIDQIIIFMVAEDGQVEIFKEDTKDYLPMLDEMMVSFYDNLDTEELVA